ncbi:hypothetical protein HC231_12950 [Brenneria izadpanahii]|uniref:Uncharacterized protein n=1 Tax=Brenneria izadpanahii TaxID=2722756 RepID=A0ABX7USZ6_9GAMM|nr:hypothetical protein [Brenneria izadpanahii]QTF08709.1 hypothetical protein HC231_12950 [Brenneria izadpanahii]
MLVTIKTDNDGKDRTFVTEYSQKWQGYRLDKNEDTGWILTFLDEYVS